MASFIWDIFTTAADWKDYYTTNFNLQLENQLKILINILEQSELGAKSKMLQNDIAFVTVGPNDVIDLSPYAGAMPVAIVGKNAGGVYEAVSAGAGYQVNAATDLDQIILTGQGINIPGVANAYTFGFGLSAGPNTIQWTSGTYTAVKIFFINISSTLN